MKKKTKYEKSRRRQVIRAAAHRREELVLQSRLKQRFGYKPPETVLEHPGIVGARVSVHGWQRFLLRYTMWKVVDDPRWVQDTKAFWSILGRAFSRAEEVHPSRIAESVKHRRKQKGRYYQESRYFRDPHTKLWFVLDLYENNLVTVLPHFGYMENEFHRTTKGWS